MKHQRYIEVGFTKRNVFGRALLLDSKAPKTCKAVWDALPLMNHAYHAKYANCEVYSLFKPFAAEEPGKENATVFPIPSDLVYFRIEPGSALPPDAPEPHPEVGVIDLALFYGRGNFLLGPEGLLPGNVFGTVVEGLEELAVACESIWREGSIGEQMVWRRIEEKE